MNLARHPRVRLAHLPTPLEPMERLTRALGGPRLWVKRDDQTGLAGGGNKTRKLEFLLGRALAEDADTVITCGGVQSNHARQTAAAAARLDLACELVLTRKVPGRPPAYEATGNVQLDHLLGARVHLHPAEGDRAALMADRAEALRRQGRRPAVFPTGGSTAVGALGYVGAALELVAQAADLGLVFDHVVVPTSSAGTHAGLLAGLTALNHPARVLGIDVEAEPEAGRAAVAELAAATAAEADAPDVPPGAVHVVPGYAGDGYGIPTDEMVAAVRQAARAEGLLLDPVYNGKAMAALIGLIGSGEIPPEATVVFLHTGGLPGLFAYGDSFADR